MMPDVRGHVTAGTTPSVTPKVATASSTAIPVISVTATSCSVPEFVPYRSACSACSSSSSSSSSSPALYILCVFLTDVVYQVGALVQSFRKGYRVVRLNHECQPVWTFLSARTLRSPTPHQP